MEMPSCYELLNQYSPGPRAQLDCWEGRYATARAVRTQIYAGLGSYEWQSNHCLFMVQKALKAISSTALSAAVREI